MSETANNANGLSTSNASADGVWETLCVNASSEPLPTFFFTFLLATFVVALLSWAGAPDHSDSWPVGIGNDAIRLGHGPLTASGRAGRRGDGF